MSSPNSTSYTRSSYVFAIGALAASAVGVLTAADRAPASLVTTAIVMLCAAPVGAGLYRALAPLARGARDERGAAVEGRARVALEREKTFVLRSIKELEFDRAMGKISDGDFAEMVSRLRARAMDLIRQLDAGAIVHGDEIDRELAKRLARAVEPRPPAALAAARLRCPSCLRVSSPGARFCDRCGEKLEGRYVHAIA
jgi:hypothetical protein